MGAQGNASITHTETRVQVQEPNPDLNMLGRQGSLYSLTLDEIQNQLGGGLEKPLSSMNLDELLWLAEGTDLGSTPQQQQQQQPASRPSLNRQCSASLSRDLRQKTVDELWRDIQQEEKRSTAHRNATLGKMTLEGFLAKAGAVAEPPPAKNVIEATKWNMNYQASSFVPQQQPPSMMVPVYPLVNVAAAYTESQMAVASSSLPVIGCGFPDTQTPSRKRMVAPEDVAEKGVERRQKRMIKNRESAARSRARKQAYTHELENKVSRLEEENERLRKRQEWEKVLPPPPPPPPPEPKYQLRRTSSASF